MDIERLKEEQLEAASKVITDDLAGEPKTIGGCDCAYSDKAVIAAVVVCDANMNPLEKQTAVVESAFPYMLGMLYYREGEAIKAAFAKLGKRPDVLLVDGNGVLHPLRCGMASQLGVELGQATIGVAKTRMLGDEDEAGNITVGKELLGMELRTKEVSKPLYISVGHKVSLENAVAIVQKSIRHPHKLPEPLHLAHKFANSLRKRIKES